MVRKDIHVMVLAQPAEILIQVFDSLLVRLDTFALETLAQLPNQSVFTSVTSREGR